MTDTMPRRLPRHLLVGVALVLAFVLLPHAAFGASAGGGAPMPWTGPLQSLLNNLSGPTARIIGAPHLAADRAAVASQHPGNGGGTQAPLAEQSQRVSFCEGDLAIQHG